MNKETISPIVVKRMPKYYRAISELADIRISRVSSKQLSKLTGFNASQIRQDLNALGEFGQQGYGYNVKVLKEAIEDLLNISAELNIIVVGTDHLGLALIDYLAFSGKNFKVKAVFTKDGINNAAIDTIPVFSVNTLESYLSENPTDICVLASSQDAAQKIADICEQNGVKGIWNFTNKNLIVSDNFYVEDVWLCESLYSLGHFIKKAKDQE